ncbi:MAG TPA: ABC transporter permease [Spirochaetes bacterium]|nr:ABC transporter permease [Spirochaetota bacterium]
MKLLKILTGQREFGNFLVVVVIFITMSFVSPYFMTRTNMHALLLALSIQTIIGVGMTILMVSGGFDLSVGSVVGLTGMVAGMLIKKAGIPVPAAIIMSLLVGAAIGLFHGLMVTKVGLNPFIVTLAGLSLYRGLTLIINDGKQVAQIGDVFSSIGQYKLFGIQMPIWYAIVFIIVGDILLRRNKYLRQNFFIGGNETAARLLGIQVDNVQISNYILTSVIAAFAGVVWTGRMGTATVYAGTGLELKVITAVIIGGASLNGGEGSVLGAFLGSLIMVLIINILTLVGIKIYWQNFLIGAILLFAVTLDVVTIKRRERTILKTMTR